LWRAAISILSSKTWLEIPWHWRISGKSSHFALFVVLALFSKFSKYIEPISIFLSAIENVLSLQCYDRYLQKNLRRAAEERGHTIWARGPENAGHYNSEPNLTGFFCDGGDYDSYYGRFFLNWYSQMLVDHADRVLMLARLAFEGSNIAVKVSYHCYLLTSNSSTLVVLGPFILSFINLILQVLK
jgi:hypothetical protein